MRAQGRFLYRSNQGANPDLRLAFAALASFVLMGCAATSAPGDVASRDPRAATCPPRVGQAESEFLRCGCFRDYGSSSENVELLSQTNTASGAKRVYSCQDVGAYRYTVTVVNGKVSDLSGPAK